MRKFLVSGLLSLLTFFCLSTVPKNLSADALSILSNTPASMLDLGLFKLQRRLDQIGEGQDYPKPFQPPKVMYNRSGGGKNERQRGIEIQAMSRFQIFAKKEDALVGCQNWIEYMRLRAGYNATSQKYVLDWDDSNDDRISFFVLEFDNSDNFAISGIREAIENKIRLYCNASFSEPEYGSITLYAKIGDVGFQQLR